MYLISGGRTTMVTQQNTGQYRPTNVTCGADNLLSTTSVLLSSTRCLASTLFWKLETLRGIQTLFHNEAVEATEFSTATMTLLRLTFYGTETWLMNNEIK